MKQTKAFQVHQHDAPELYNRDSTRLYKASAIEHALYL